MPFKFPSPGRNFTKATIFENSNDTTFNGSSGDKWRLCRKPECLVCVKSPEAFVSHMDCSMLAMLKVTTLSYSYIWHIGLWSHPGAGPYYPPLAPWVVPGPNILARIMKGLESLPRELCLMIASYCPESFLWRYSTVVYPPKIFSGLGKRRPIAISLSDLPGWHRGKLLPSSSRLTPAEHRFVRMSLDGYGIRKVEFFSHWPEASSDCAIAQGTWYIVEAFDHLAMSRFQSTVNDISLNK